MKLNLKERIEVTNLLPEQGDILTPRLGMQIAELMFPTADEQVDMEVTRDGSVWKWNNEKGKVEKDVVLSSLQIGLIRQELSKLNDAKTLKPEQMSLYEKFVETAVIK